MPIWLKSYLFDRFQTVSVKSTQSYPVKRSCGVPQGSVLGPDFTLYITTEACASTISHHDLNLRFYADEPQLLKGPIKAVFVRKGTLKIDPIMKVQCISWPLNLIKCLCHESKYVYEGRNACRSGRILSACFNLEIRARPVT